MPDDRDHPDFEPSLLLQGHLQRLYRRDVTIPEAQRDALMKLARREGNRRRWTRRVVRLAPFAAAAMVGLAIWLVDFGPSDTAQQQVAVVDTRDINGDGRVDILDAMLLAKRLEQGAPDELH